MSSAPNFRVRPRGAAGDGGGAGGGGGGGAAPGPRVAAGSGGAGRRRRQRRQLWGLGPALSLRRPWGAGPGRARRGAGRGGPGGGGAPRHLPRRPPRPRAAGDRRGRVGARRGVGGGAGFSRAGGEAPRDGAGRRRCGARRGAGSAGRCGDAAAVARSAAVRRRRPPRPCGSDDDVVEFAAFLPRLFPAGGADGRVVVGMAGSTGSEPRVGKKRAQPQRGKAMPSAGVTAQGAPGLPAARPPHGRAEPGGWAGLGCAVPAVRWCSSERCPKPTLKSCDVFSSLPSPHPPHLRIAANAFGRREHRERGWGAADRSPCSHEVSIGVCWPPALPAASCGCPCQMQLFIPDPFACRSLASAASVCSAAAGLVGLLLLPTELLILPTVEDVLVLS